MFSRKKWRDKEIEGEMKDIQNIRDLQESTTFSSLCDQKRWKDTEHLRFLVSNMFLIVEGK